MKHKIQVTQSLRKTQLNKDSRERITNAIMRDVFKDRSDALRKQWEKWQELLRNETFGSTPQARTALKKRMQKLKDDIAITKQKGALIQMRYLGVASSHLEVNLAGRNIYTWFKSEPSKSPLINADDEFLSRSQHCYQSLESILLANNELTLKADHKLVKQFDELIDQSRKLKEAGEEFKAMVSSILAKSRTVGAALDNWPEIENHLPAIMSECREVIVKPEDLTAKMQAIKSGEDIIKAMKATG